MGRHSSIPILYDFCKQLSISDLKTWGYLKQNQITKGIIRFTSHNYDILEVFINVNTKKSKPFIELKYSINNNLVKYHIYFELLPSGYFGVMTPPVSVKLRHFERSYNDIKNLSFNTIQLSLS